MTHQDRMLVDFRGLKTMGIPYCRAHIYRLIDTGDFPQPIKLGKYRGSRIAWLYQDILNWIERWRRPQR